VVYGKAGAVANVFEKVEGQKVQEPAQKVVSELLHQHLLPEHGG